MKTTNLDIYGSAPLEWSRAERLLAGLGEQQTTFFLATVRPDGRPHQAGVGALWIDGRLYIVSGPETRKSRNLDARPDCAVSVGLPGMDLVIEGRAVRVTDGATLEKVAASYRAVGWPATVEGAAFTAPYSAPSAGRPPYFLYELAPRTAIGVASEEPHGATKWEFDD
jgi:hypothetical protein